ncbi:hypothetical protein RND81_08G039800 [Saponaria officinalis]|uniref:Histone-lysine N-methyltransferase ASHR3 n=1 Tax=Saponaria officinalis TaxID=3572 RepID=A0AAW1J3A8_SAPOF
MPDLGATTLLNSETLTLTLTRSPNSLPKLTPPSNSSDTLRRCSAGTLMPANWPDTRPEPPINGGVSVAKSGILKIRVTAGTRVCSGDSIDVIEGSKKVLEDYVSDWKARRIDSGVSENRCFLPFLVGAPSLVECRVCSSYIYPGSEISCSVRGCQGIYHLKCAKETFQCFTLKNFKCPQHACFLCKQKFFWRCVRCEIASHDKCAAWPNEVIHLSEQPGWAVCWRHPKDWRHEQNQASTTSFEDIFARLPLPYVEEEFKIESTVKDYPCDRTEPPNPPSYVHIRRNIYLVKRKRDGTCVELGCVSCNSSSTCSKDCLCRVQSISCSRACRCSEACTNRPFRKDKKIKIVKTGLCGWGVEAAESINKGDFVIEYVGEVVDDVECTQRLWAMKNKDVKNFYMCEIRKDFTIDATFKGNASRFLNHSCDPNCKMEKWQVEGEIRVGVFATRSIEVGEPLTYDYRFVQFGPEVKCHCGAPNCQGYLGAKRKINLDVLESKRRLLLASLCWGSKRRRTMATQVRTLQNVQ